MNIKKMKFIFTELLQYINLLLLVSMVIIVSYQIFSRYVLNTPLSWSEEIAKLMLVWLVMLGVIYAFIKDEHLEVEFIKEQLSIKIQKALDVLKYLCWLIFSVAIIYSGYELFQITSSQSLPATELNAFILFLPLPISAFIILVYMASKVIMKFMNNNIPGGKK